MFGKDDISLKGRKVSECLLGNSICTVVGNYFYIITIAVLKKILLLIISLLFSLIKNNIKLWNI